MNRFATAIGVVILGASTICAQQTQSLPTSLLPDTAVNADVAPPAKTSAPFDSAPSMETPGKSEVAPPAKSPPKDVTSVPDAVGTLPSNCPAGTNCFAQEGTCSPRLWIDGEYLLWTVKHGPIDVPLVSGNKTCNGVNTGALNEPGTYVLFGNRSGASTDFGWLSGGRWTLGANLDQEGICGAEVTGFVLEPGDVKFSASSAGGTAPLVSIPFTATQTPTQGWTGIPAGPAALTADGLPNTVTAHLASQLWGIEANSLTRLYTSNCCRWSGLVGFRYLDLHESLNLDDSFLDTERNSRVSVNDNFTTSNHFYGGQLGNALQRELVPLESGNNLEGGAGLQ